jgi:hypothetical protein
MNYQQKVFHTGLVKGRGKGTDKSLAKGLESIAEVLKKYGL